MSEIVSVDTRQDGGGEGWESDGYFFEGGGSEIPDIPPMQGHGVPEISPVGEDTRQPPEIPAPSNEDFLWGAGHHNGTDVIATTQDGLHVDLSIDKEGAMYSFQMDGVTGTLSSNDAEKDLPPAAGDDWSGGG